MDVFFLLFFAFRFVEIPDFHLFVVDDIVEEAFGINTVLVNFIEILSHLCGLATEDAELAVLLYVHLGVYFKKLKQHVDGVDQSDATPLHDSFLDGEHLWQPYGFLVFFFELVA